MLHWTLYFIHFKWFPWGKLPLFKKIKKVVTQELTKETGEIQSTCPLSHQFKCDPKLLTSECHLLTSARSPKGKEAASYAHQIPPQSPVVLSREGSSNDPQKLPFPPPTSALHCLTTNQLQRFIFQWNHWLHHFFFVCLFWTWVSTDTQDPDIFVSSKCHWPGRMESTYCSNIINMKMIITVIYCLLSIYDVSGTVLAFYMTSKS